jgi:hypothetical protein
VRFGPGQQDAIAAGVAYVAAAWLVLHVALRLEAAVASGVAAVLACGLAWQRARVVRASPGISVEAEALVLEGSGGRRRIPWTEVTAVARAVGIVATPWGPARVGALRLQFAAGDAVAFADLSALGATEIALDDGATPVLEVAEPEVLAHIVTSRIGATDPDLVLQSPPAHPWFDGSAREALGAIALAALVLRGTSVLWEGSPSDAVSALAGAGLVVGLAVAARVGSHRFARGTAPDEAHLLGLAAVLVAGLAIHSATDATSHAALGGWSLATSIALALPVPRMPGGALARALGARAVAWRPLVACAALAAAGMVPALLFARGMTVLPLALLAGLVEALDARAARLAGARLALAPRLRSLAPEARAALRAGLRASFGDARDARSDARLHRELRRIDARPARVATLALVAALLATAVVVARRSLHGTAPSARDAMRVVAS